MWELSLGEIRKQFAVRGASLRRLHAIQHALAHANSATNRAAPYKQSQPSNRRSVRCNRDAVAETGPLQGCGEGHAAHMFDSSQHGSALFVISERAEQAV